MIIAVRIGIQRTFEMKLYAFRIGQFQSPGTYIRLCFIFVKRDKESKKIIKCCFGSILWYLKPLFLTAMIGLAIVDKLIGRKEYPTVPVKDGPILLEVKWDAFLPDVIRDAVQLYGVRTSSFSKYAACRMYD